jgi:hypothetical protein
MNLPPLPEPDTHCFDDESGTPKDVWSHSAEQMTAYATTAVLAERERCAAIVENMEAPNWPHHVETTFDFCEALASEIRGATSDRSTADAALPRQPNKALKGTS